MVHAIGITAEIAVEARLRAGNMLRLHNWYSLERRDGQSGWQPVEFGPGTDRQRSYMAQLDSLARMLERKPHTLASLREAYEVQSTIEALLGSSR